MRQSVGCCAVATAVLLALTGCTIKGGDRIHGPTITGEVIPSEHQQGQSARLQVRLRDHNTPGGEPFMFEVHVGAPPQVRVNGSPWWNGSIARGVTEDHDWSIAGQESGIWTLNVTAAYLWNPSDVDQRSPTDFARINFTVLP